MIITFTGHSSLYHRDSVKEKIKNAITENIPPDDTVKFYCGGYGDFDNLCAEVCSSIKEDFPMCEVVFITPYITESHQAKLKTLIDSKLYDSVIYPPLENVPLRYAISRRNEWMANEADLVIAYVMHARGGAYKTLEYARKKKKPIINLAE